MQNIQRYSARTLAAVLTFVMLLAAVCLSGVAQAYAQTGTLRVEGVRDGDSVHAYLVVKRTPYGAEFNGDYGISMSEYLAAGSNTPAMKECADTIFSKIAAAGTKPDKSGTSNGGDVVLSGLGYGQYLISVTPTPPGCGKVYQSTIVTLEDAEEKVVLKSEPITITKTINGAHETDMYAVGQRVPFLLETHVPTYPAKATHKVFRIKDVCTAGLSFGEGDISVTCGDATLAAGDAYTYSQANENGNVAHVLEFNYDKIAQYAGQPIQVHINALVTEAAVPATADVNTAKVYFRNNPFVDSGDDEDTDEAKVHTYGIYLQKVNQESKDPLAGAKFEVLKEDASGDVDVTDGDGAVHKAAKVGELVTGEDGYGSVKGLAAGVYYLRETEAPEGYGIVDTVVEVTLPSTAASSEGVWAGYAFGGAVEDPQSNIEEEETPTDDHEDENEEEDKTPNKKAKDTDVVDDDTPRSSFAPQTSDIVMGGVVVVLVVAAGAGVVALRKRKEQ